MGRQKINSITFADCGKSFDFNTEEIEWTKLDDMGVRSTNPKTKQAGLIEEFECPYCCKANRLAFEQYIA